MFKNGADQSTNKIYVCAFKCTPQLRQSQWYKHILAHQLTGIDSMSRTSMHTYTMQNWNVLDNNNADFFTAFISVSCWPSPCNRQCAQCSDPPYVTLLLECSRTVRCSVYAYCAHVKGDARNECSGHGAFKVISLKTNGCYRLPPEDAPFPGCSRSSESSIPRMPGTHIHYRIQMSSEATLTTHWNTTVNPTSVHVSGTNNLWFRT